MVVTKFTYSQLTGLYLVDSDVVANATSNAPLSIVIDHDGERREFEYEGPQWDVEPGLIGPYGRVEYWRYSERSGSRQLRLVNVARVPTIS